MVSAEDTAARKRSRFKIVCEDCASLSIKVADPANSPNATLVRCGRCNAARGTLEELHDLARRGVRNSSIPANPIGRIAHAGVLQSALRSELINVLQ
jgi:hypothetical protein